MKNENLFNGVTIINSCRLNTPELKVQDFINYLKENNIAYANYIPTYLKKEGLIESNRKGYISFKNQPLHIAAFKHVIMSIKNDLNKIKERNRNKEEFFKSLTIYDILQNLEKEGYSVKAGDISIDTTSAIQIAKLLGFKIYKSKIIYEEI